MIDLWLFYLKNPFKNHLISYYCKNRFQISIQQMFYQNIFTFSKKSERFRKVINDSAMGEKNDLLKYLILWKTIPGRLKQVPQDSPEWDRTDTGHCTFSLTRVILILTHFLNPLVKVIRNIYTGSYFMRFIRDRPHVLYNLKLKNCFKFDNTAVFIGGWGAVNFKGIFFYYFYFLLKIFFIC